MIIKSASYQKVQLEYEYCAGVALAEIDTLTGEVKIRESHFL